MELQPPVYTMESTSLYNEELESSQKLLDVSGPNDQGTWEIHSKVLGDGHKQYNRCCSQNIHMDRDQLY